MTRIADRKTSLKAETNARYRGKPLVIECTPWGLRLRQKGRRSASAYEVPYETIFELGAKLLSIERRKEKAARRNR